MIFLIKAMISFYKRIEIMPLSKLTITFLSFRTPFTLYIFYIINNWSRVIMENTLDTIIN